MSAAAGGETAGQPDARRAPLDRETIVDAAQRILDAEGLGGLTMRRIGTELGVDPAAVYRHFRNKDALVVALADRAFASIREPDRSLPWQQRLRALLWDALRLYRGRPDFAMALAHQPDDTPGLERVAELCLEMLGEVGLDARGRAYAFQLITNYAVGSGLYISQLALDDWAETIPAVRRGYATLPPEQYPNCVASAEHLWPDLDEVYDLGLDMLIAGIERLAQGVTTTEERT
jgi:AcrR family transcriptional regulator